MKSSHITLIYMVLSLLIGITTSIRGAERCGNVDPTPEELLAIQQSIEGLRGDQSASVIPDVITIPIAFHEIRDGTLA